MLLFQDLAVVPLLIADSRARAAAGRRHGGRLSLAHRQGGGGAGDAAVRRPAADARAGFDRGRAAQKSHELFVLNVLLITLVLAYITESAGLSLVLGAFLAGMLISETEYRYQVEEDIKPFRDVLLGLVLRHDRHDARCRARVCATWRWCRARCWSLLVALKVVLIAGFAPVVRQRPAPRCAPGSHLAQAGEFGFVLLSLRRRRSICAASDAAAGRWRRWCCRCWRRRSSSSAASVSCCALSRRGMDAALAGAASRRGAVDGGQAARGQSCGYGRSGQSLARLLDSEGFGFIALDLDPGARAARPPPPANAWCTAIARAAKCWSRPACCAPRAGGDRSPTAALALRILAHVHELNPACRSSCA